MSNADEVPQQSPPVPDPFRRRFAVLRYALFLVALIAVAEFAWMHRRTQLDIQLHGNFEEAAAALEEALAKMPPAKHLPFLLKLIRDDSFGARYAAIDMLGQERGPGVADAIEFAFTDSASVVRQRALEVLSSIDRERGLRLLLAGLRDDDYWIRDAAIGQIAVLAGRPGTAVDKRVVPMLMKVLDDEDETVPVMALNTLKKLTGHNWRYRVKSSVEQKKAVLAACRQWWAKDSASWTVSPDLADVKPIQPSRRDPAPGFALRDFDGRSVSLRGQEGRITLLNFWGTNCGPCLIESPDLVRLDTEFREHGVDIIGIVHAEKVTAPAKKWCEEHGVTYRQALDSPEILEDYGGIHDVPVSVLIDGRGRIRYRFDGNRDYGTFYAAVDHLLREARSHP